MLQIVRITVTKAEGSGFGLGLQDYNGGTRIHIVAPGAAGAAAGVQVKDVVVAVDGASMAGKLHGDVAAAMRGKTSITLQLARATAVTDKPAVAAVAAAPSAPPTETAANATTKPYTAPQKQQTSPSPAEAPPPAYTMTSSTAARPVPPPTVQMRQRSAGAARPAPAPAVQMRQRSAGAGVGRLVDITLSKQASQGLRALVAPKQGLGVFLLRKKGTGQEIVDRVTPGSPAQVGGLIPGDALVAVNGVAVKGKSHEGVIKMLVSAREAGPSFTVQVLRRGAAHYPTGASVAASQGYSPDRAYGPAAGAAAAAPMRYPLPPAGYPLQPSPFGTSSSNGAAAGAFAGETVNNESNKWIFPVEREFKVADKVFSLSDSMSVKDETGRTVINAKSQWFSIGFKVTIEDAATGEEIYYMQEKVLSISGKMKIKRGGETRYTLRQNIVSFTGTTNVYRGKPHFGFTGNTKTPVAYSCSGVEFWFGTKIKDGQGNVAAYIREKIFHASALLDLDMYKIIVLPGHDAALMISILVAMDKLRRKDD